MTQTDIEVFSAIARYKTIGKAAEALFLAPSTVGAHLKSLEEEFGVRLIERKKGIKSITLTDAGVRFEGIATHMLSLMKECAHLSDISELPLLTVATADSLLDHNLVPLYRQLLYAEKCFKFDIRRYPSNMIYPLIGNREVDIGFTVFQLSYADVDITPLFSDDTVIIASNDFQISTPTVHPSALDPEKELFIGSTDNDQVGWGAVFNEWRKSVIDTRKQPQLCVNNVSILSYFLDGGDFWAFLPRTIARGYRRNHDLKIIELECSAPKRDCYMLTHKHCSDRTKSVIDLFQTYLYEYLELIQLTN